MLTAWAAISLGASRVSLIHKSLDLHYMYSLLFCSLVAWAGRLNWHIASLKRGPGYFTWRRTQLLLADPLVLSMSVVDLIHASPYFAALSPIFSILGHVAMPVSSGCKATL